MPRFYKDIFNCNLQHNYGGDLNKGLRNNGSLLFVEANTNFLKLTAEGLTSYYTRHSHILTARKLQLIWQTEVFVLRCTCITQFDSTATFRIASRIINLHLRNEICDRNMSFELNRQTYGCVFRVLTYDKFYDLDDTLPSVLIVRPAKGFLRLLTANIICNIIEYFYIIMLPTYLAILSQFRHTTKKKTRQAIK